MVAFPHQNRKGQGSLGQREVLRCGGGEAGLLLLSLGVFAPRRRVLDVLRCRQAHGVKGGVMHPLAQKPPPNPAHL